MSDCYLAMSEKCVVTPIRCSADMVAAVLESFPCQLSANIWVLLGNGNIFVIVGVQAEAGGRTGAR